jgi:formiminotetrahydrofolate cyclodeaminase
MPEQSIGAWLDELASAAPAPGGGAAAALAAAMAAALVEMVCNLTIGKPAFAEHEPALEAVRGRAATLRAESLVLVAEDATAFAAVIDAYKLPRETDAERQRRHDGIQHALAGAAEVPHRTALAAAELVALAASIVTISNPNVVSDVAAAAASARAALSTALVNIEINRISITDPALQETLATAMSEIELELDHADAVVAAVRARMLA